jgi:hypothetical protein
LPEIFRLLAREKREAVGIDRPLFDGDAFQDHLSAFHGKSADLNGTQGREIHFMFGEDFAHQRLDPAQVSGTGHEGAKLDDRGAVIFLKQDFQRVANLRRQEAFGGKRGDAKDQPVGLARGRGGRVLQQRKGLGDGLFVFFFLFLAGLAFGLRDGGHREGEGEENRQYSSSGHV